MAPWVKPKNTEVQEERTMSIQKIEPGTPESQSADILADNLARLKALFPELVTEGAKGPAINVDVLKTLVGDATATDADERYGLNWHGKRAARQLALTPSTGTLRPRPEESLDWDTTQNLMIEGDNLEVLKLLQKSYGGKVKLIYIDPPYNTGKDFVYPDNFRDSIKNYLEITNQSIGGRKVSSNAESSGRFHTDWLNMMYPRLLLARNLLTDDGAIFISLDDTEIANAQLLLHEIFGEENFRANISWQKRYTRSNNTVDFTTVVEHILVYSKSDSFVVNLLERTKEADARYSNPDKDPRGPWKGASILNPATPEQRPKLCYPITNPNTGKQTLPTKNAWRRSKEEFDRLSADNRLYWGADGTQDLPAIKMFLSEAREITPVNFWDHAFAGNTDDGTRDLRDILGEKVFDNPKPVKLIERVIEHGAEKDSIILDFFAGSGTTAQAVIQKNISDGGRRRFILVQLPEPIDPVNNAASATFCERNGLPASIFEITKERIRRFVEKQRSAGIIFDFDGGFKAFALDESCVIPWSAQRNEIQDSLLTHVDNIRPDRSELDILHELIVKLGLDVSVEVERRAVGGVEIISLGKGTILLCLAKFIRKDASETLASALINWWKELSPAVPTTVVFRDNAFEDDVTKLNLAATLSQAGMQVIKTI